MVELELVRKLIDVRTPIRTLYLDMCGSENFDLTPWLLTELDDENGTVFDVELDINGHGAGSSAFNNCKS